MHTFESIRVMTYNLLAGGQDPAYGSVDEHPHRLGSIGECIHDCGYPDIIGLVDTYGFATHPGILSAFADSLGYRYFANTALQDERLIQGGSDNGVGVLSKYPITDCHPVFIHSRNALCFTVMDTPTGSYTIAVIYLDDLSETVRVKQVKALISRLPKARTILLGDLNAMALGEFQQRMENNTGLFANEVAIGTRFFPAIEQMQKGEVLPVLAQGGFIDWMGRIQDPPGTVPTKLISPFTRLFRVDYVLTTHDILVSDITSPDGPLYDVASDHYPVVATVHRIIQ